MVRKRISGMLKRRGKGQAYRDAGATTDDAATAVGAKVAFFTDADESSRSYVRVADGTESRM